MITMIEVKYVTKKAGTVSCFSRTFRAKNREEIMDFINGLDYTFYTVVITINNYEVHD